MSTQEAAAKREITSVKFQKWEAGKPVGAKFWAKFSAATFSRPVVSDVLQNVEGQLLSDVLAL